jgi:glyoxylase-like metal-dependent hydrolase (beta-lactamase superfamily II)
MDGAGPLARLAVTEPLDLLHLGRPKVIGCYLLETADGPALFDCGPATCVPALEARLAERGLELRDLRHLLLSHIHLDHAGAAGTLVREHPALQVHVSGIGAAHLVDPERLERSARRLYGDEFETLWGELVPIPEEKVHPVGSEVLGLECFPTPGHASHHVCYLDADGTLYAGDATGVRIQPSRAVLPPTPPPEFDRETWQASLDEIERRNPARLALIHFGVADDPARHLGELRERLERWTEWVGQGLAEEDFVAAAAEDLGPDAAAYEQAMPFWQSYAGLERYWAKKLESTAGA